MAILTKSWLPEQHQGDDSPAMFQWPLKRKGRGVGEVGEVAGVRLGAGGGAGVCGLLLVRKQFRPQNGCLLLLWEWGENSTRTNLPFGMVPNFGELSTFGLMSCGCRTSYVNKMNVSKVNVNKVNAHSPMPKGIGWTSESSPTSKLF